MEWMGRPSPTAYPHASDDEGGDENECDNMAELEVDTLLGLNDNGNDDVEDDIVASI